MLSKHEADQIFLDNAVCVNGKDIFPINKALEYFGEYVVESIIKEHGVGIKGGGDFYNKYWLGSLYIEYFTYKGFLEAVTYYNIIQYNTMKNAKDNVINFNKKPLEVRRILPRA